MADYNPFDAPAGDGDSDKDAPDNSSIPDDDLPF